MSNNRLDSRIERERIGRIIRDRRIELGIGNHELAEATRSALSVVYAAQSGRIVTTHGLLKICDYLGLEVVVQKPDK